MIHPTNQQFSNEKSIDLECPRDSPCCILEAIVPEGVDGIQLLLPLRMFSKSLLKSLAGPRVRANLN